jgi:hypothetical protein
MPKNESPGGRVSRLGRRLVIPIASAVIGQYIPSHVTCTDIYSAS